MYRDEGASRNSHGTTEIIFEVTEAVEGGYYARALGYGIFTQGDDWEKLKEMVKDAVLCHFFDDDSISGAIHLVLGPGCV